MNYCALNVALYGACGRRGGGRWAYTEHETSTVRRAPDVLSIGPSRVAWNGNELAIEIDEIAAPLPVRIRGVVRLAVGRPLGARYALDSQERHRWQPIAPDARIDVRMDAPRLAWSGSGYLDANEGDEPLEDAFRRWHWGRARTRNAALITYDVFPHTGEARELALRIGDDGRVERFGAPPLVRLPATRWRVARAVRSDAPAATRVLATLEDTPFYARSLVSNSLDGEQVTTMHESLSLDRFRRPWVRALLPFRMRR